MTSNEWKNYKFSELVYILGGGTPKTNVSEYWNGTIPWLSVKDFNSIKKFDHGGFRGVQTIVIPY